MFDGSVRRSEAWICSLPFVHSFFVMEVWLHKLVRSLFVFLPCVRFGGKDKNMAYNHGKEEKQFQRMWRRFRKEYREAGMSDEAIEEMYRFDRDVFNRDRAFEIHRHIPLPMNNYYSDEYDPDYYEEPEYPVSDESSPEHSRYWWTEEIDNPMLAAYIKTLSSKDIDLITMFYFEGFTQKEIAEKMVVSQQAVSKRLAQFERIKKKIKNF